MVKNLPAIQETWVRLLGQEDPLEKVMATHSSIFAWRIPWSEQPGRLQSTGSQRVGHDWATEHNTKLVAAILASINKICMQLGDIFLKWAGILFLNSFEGRVFCGCRGLHQKIPLHQLLQRSAHRSHALPLFLDLIIMSLYIKNKSGIGRRKRHVHFQKMGNLLSTNQPIKQCYTYENILVSKKKK